MCAQEARVALAAVAEAEVATGGDRGDVELTEQRVGHEGLGRGGEQRAVAAADEEMLDTELAQQLGLAPQRRQSRRCRRRDSSTSRGCGSNVTTPSGRPQRAGMLRGDTDHLTVAAMDPVEVADRHRGTARRRREAGVITVDAHGGLSPMRPRACKERPACRTGPVQSRSGRAGREVAAIGPRLLDRAGEGRPRVEAAAVGADGRERLSRSDAPSRRRTGPVPRHSRRGRSRSRPPTRGPPYGARARHRPARASLSPPPRRADRARPRPALRRARSSASGCARSCRRTRSRNRTSSAAAWSSGSSRTGPGWCRSRCSMMIVASATGRSPSSSTGSAAAARAPRTRRRCPDRAGRAAGGERRVVLVQRHQHLLAVGRERVREQAQRHGAASNLSSRAPAGAAPW